jgi:hypothetical protein
VPPQRAAALRMLAAVLAAARPAARDVLPGGRLRERPVALPAQAAQSGYVVSEPLPTLL